MNDIQPDYERLSWISQRLHIIDKDSRFTLLGPNNGQLLLHSEIQQQRGRDLQVQIVLLKPRQVGWTTWCEAEAFYDVWHYPNNNAMTVSVDADSTDVVFGMARRFHENMGEYKRPTDNTNRKAIIFSTPHRSAFYAQTAGKKGVGRSFQVRFLHCSELAFWEDAATQLAGLYQMVPKGAGTCVILESTANGMGGAFYDTYWSAKERKESHPGDYHGFRPVFFPWFEFPEYSKEPPDWFEPSHDEKGLSKEFGLTNGQLFWRRWKIEQMNGDEALFRQEYPSTDIEAFQSTGQPVFSTAILRRQMERSVRDVRYGLFDPPSGDFIEHDRPYGWQLIGSPGRSNYVIGVDTAEFRLSDEKDPKSKRDYDAVVVLDRRNKEVNAIFHGRMSQMELGRQVLGAARYFNHAWVVPEIPMGMGVLQVLVNADYPNIYSRERKKTTYSPESTDDLGYRTSSTTRRELVNDLVSAFHSDRITAVFIPIIEEMKTFIYDKTGKPIHMPAKKDDLIFALGLALQGDIACPGEVFSELPARTGEIEREREKSFADLATVGAIDDFDDDDWDEEDWEHTV